MSKFDDIRKNLSNEAINILDTVWLHHIDKKRWIPTSALIFRLGEDVFNTGLRNLNASILIEDSNLDEKRCRLTFLGTLLTSKGEEGLSLLEKCANYIQKGLRAESELYRFTAREVADSFNLQKKDLILLEQFICGSFFTEGGGTSALYWSYNISPKMRNELFLKENFREYICQKALKDYDEAKPVLWNDREKYSLSLEKSPFSFIKDSNLKNLIEKDWNEIQNVYSAKAWKSCILLCGSVIEALLINELSQNLQQANFEFHKINKKKPPPLDKWNLVDLVKVSDELKIFPKGTIHLTNAIREFRNLVHPGKQLRDQIEITPEQASIAFNAVKNLQMIKNS